jgi:hypothetical protein
MCYLSKAHKCWVGSCFALFMKGGGRGGVSYSRWLGWECRDWIDSLFIAVSFHASAVLLCLVNNDIIIHRRLVVVAYCCSVVLLCLVNYCTIRVLVLNTYYLDVQSATVRTSVHFFFVWLTQMPRFKFGNSSEV